MNDFLDTSSQNFLYSIVEKILRKMFERVIDEAKQDLAERAEYLDIKQLSSRYSMSVPEVEQNFVKDKITYLRDIFIEKRKPKERLKQIEELLDIKLEVDSSNQPE